MAGLRLVSLNKRYDNGLLAVANVNLEIHDGEFLVLLGPSGCGKTTTLRMIAGLENVSSGEIYLDDRLIHHQPPRDRNMAMVFQSYALYQNMTVRENLAFGLRMRQTAPAEIERRISETASALCIENLLDRRPEELSGGQRQRVAVGRAIVRQPQVFLFDEPLSNLDSHLRLQMRLELARLHHRVKTTTLYVTHDQSEAMTLAARIAVMRDGVIQQVETPHNIYNFPANKFVASFIGNPGMNFVRGELQKGMFLAEGVAYPLQRHASMNGASLPFGPVEFGFRPESITTNEADPLFAKVRVDFVERLGHETIIYYSLDGRSHVARLGRRSDFSAGDEVALHLPVGEWHLFAAETNDQNQQVRLVSGRTIPLSDTVR